MREVISIEYYNDVYVRILCNSGIAQELASYFTFEVKNFQFMPKFKQGKWDGKVRLMTTRNCLLYAGLTYKVEEFAKEFDYDVEYLYENGADDFSVVEALDFIKTLNLPNHIEVRDYQLNTFVNAIRYRRRLFLSPTSCHAAGDEVLMSNGVWKLIENITINDSVIGMDGKPKKVLKIFTGKDELFEIDPKTNRKSITVTGEHLLSLKFSDSSDKCGYGKGDKNYIEYISVKDYMNKSFTYKHCSNLHYNNIAIKFIDEKDPDTKLTPYFIGLYIGDGASNACQITTTDREILEETKNQAKILDMTIRFKVEFDKIGLKFGSMDSRIRCHERHLPESLLKSTIKFRLELLAGLIDSDGYLANGTAFEYVSKSEKLCKDVSELAISLGFVTSLKTKFNKKYQKNYYKVLIMGDVERIPTRLDRKRPLTHIRKRNPYHAKFNIIEKGIGNYYGIQVEDHLYITNDGMITHNSGKSLIIYLVTRYMLKLKRKTLIVVPSISLIHQMAGDFKEYGFDSDMYVHKIHDGKEISPKPITISTWQSIYQFEPEWFAHFGAINVDEAHTAAAKSMCRLMEQCVNIPYRFGYTGTTDEEKESSELTLQGLFGKKKDVTTSAKLMSDGHIAQLMIKAIVLKHPESRAKELASIKDSKTRFKAEIDMIVGCEARNKFIKNLTLSLKGNTLILYTMVEKHGEVLHDMFLNEDLGNRKLYFIAGSGSRKMDGEERDEIRAIIEKETDAIIIASKGTTSTGYSIKNLNNLIFASPNKAKISNLQSIGRILRMSDTKNSATVYDIADDLVYKKTKNFTLVHFVTRIKIYLNEQFKYRTYLVNIK